jgi:outer membrane protein
MKKLFITLTVVAGLAFSSKAQDFGFKKGDGLLEGNISFNSSNNKNSEEKESSFSFSPKAGYFLSDKIAVGVQLGFSSEKQEDYGTGTESIDKTNVFGVGVFGRYYFLELGKRFKTYAEVGVGYATSKSETEAGGTTIEDPKVNTLGFNGGIGANYFLTERLALNVSLTNIIGFSSSKADVSGAKAVTNFGVQAGGVDNIFDIATFGLTFKF